MLAFSEGKKYFSMAMVKTFLDSENLEYAGQTVKQTLNQLTKDKMIFDAGRGWYSTLANEIKINIEPVQPIVDAILTKMPFLPFNCWSTQQLNPFFHHMLGKFIIFIYTEKDFLSTLLDFLVDEGKIAYLNPNQNEIDKSFRLEHETIVLRPSISEEPSWEHYSKIEKILIDFYIESEKLYITQFTEVQTVFENILGRNRINIPTLLRYARRRKVDKNILEIIKNIPMAL
ncbi:MAG TPA: hypothetical protein ENO01_01435 [Candidatus Marinimicrobia bacterium]|nr:hypothetical protein [Candidatus Neomarinimicrobiota bacterium]